ncbi:MAG: hypothetical protein ACLFNU_13090 [Bacteroidales bacterium]
MKTKSLISLVFIPITIVLMLLFSSSCSQEGILNHDLDIERNIKQHAIYDVNGIDKDFGKFTKELTVYDAAKENSAVILVGSDDKSILNLWNSENFSLLPREKDETLVEVADKFFSTKDEDVEMSNAEMSDFVAEISTMFISKKLKEGVANVILLTHEPREYVTRGWWSYDTHYSDHYGAGEVGSMTCFVYGYKWNNRGWWGLKYKRTFNHSWSTVVAEWKQIKNGETDDETREGYKMRARRKYRNNSVLIEFNE